MGLTVEYDHSGCRATVTWREGEEADVVLVRRLVAVSGALVPLAFAAFAGYSGSGVGLGIAGLFPVIGILVAVNSQAFSMDEAGESQMSADFEVGRGELRIRGPEGLETVHLAGARVSLFEDGLFVNPRYGEPVRLMCTDADPAELARLADALRHAGGHESGLSADVPDELKAMAPER